MMGGMVDQTRRISHLIGPRATLLAKHYLLPFRARGAEAYSAGEFWESWYATADDLTDAATISPDLPPTHARFHYNAVENGILARLPDLHCNRVLDVGSGSGHWISFYREVYQAEVTGVEISKRAADELADRYAADAGVSVRAADVSAPALVLDGRPYDLVNAIGVMFHIVDDSAWRQALANLATALAPGGVLVVGGQFGHITRNVQFHRSDHFAEWSEAKGRALVNKRIRSLRRWRQAAKTVGLRVEGRPYRTPAARGLRTPPENNLLFLRRV